MTERSIRVVTEERLGNVPLFAHPEWPARFPWLVQGTTPREAGNYSSFGEQTANTVAAQWRRTRAETGMRTSLIGRQMHGAVVIRHEALSAGHLLGIECDGHVTDAPGILLAVSVADCVPVFVVDERNRVVAALHAGWRSTAAGILANCIAIMGSEVHVHFGPAICGGCYEVGPEVHQALGLVPPAGNTPVDVRAVLATQALALGVAADNMTTSSWCTRCGDSPFFSHRAQHPERQIGVIGIL
jgi:YfiH family protein